MNDEIRREFDEWTDPPQLVVRAFGPGHVELRGCRLASSDWTYSKARELLFYLLNSPARTKEQIGLALWPDASATQVRDNFRTTLHHLRSALESADWVVYEDGSYSFNRALSYWYDAEAFEFQMSVARMALDQNLTPNLVAADRLERATALYTGDFLEGTEAEWCLLPRADLLRRYLQALVSLGEALMAAGQYADAAEVYRRAITNDSYLEAAHRGLMLSLARQGELGQALRHYQSLVSLLHDELGAPPASDTIALHERLRSGGRD